MTNLLKNNSQLGHPANAVAETIVQEDWRAYQERIAIETLCNEPTARIRAQLIVRLGPSFAGQYNGCRRISSILRRLEKHTTNRSDKLSLAVALRSELVANYTACDLIEKSLSVVDRTVTIVDFHEVIRSAANDDLSAMQVLQRLALLLRPHMLDPRGRPMSPETGAHIVFLDQLNKEGRRPRAYTISPLEHKFNDANTLATQRAFGRKFDPRPACRFLKMHSIA